ncbi:hypothetical protein OIU76_007178 [Salix suchowensis]|nr:hypothetical protein OIU76_007178 [Salix suchowensis]
MLSVARGVAGTEILLVHHRLLGVRQAVSLSVVVGSARRFSCSRFSDFLRHSREPIAIYKSHLLLEKLWHDIETDNSTALEVFSFYFLI